MKFRALTLHAYGALTDVSFTFDGSTRLEILFGRNEAGKSTTLRAISAFLYGFSRARDATVHRFSALRISANLESAEGQTYALERRTEQTKSVMVTADGSRVDDATLVRILGGVEKASFESMYGLNHETLKKGADALLTHGEAGENLFGAALGGSALRQTLDELEKRAKELHSDSANAKNALIAKLKREFEEASRNVQLSTSLESAYTENVRALDEKRRERAQHQAAMEQWNHRRDRIVSSLAILAPLRQRRVLLDREAALGTTVMLPENAKSVREEAERALRANATARERAQHEKENAETKLATLRDFDAILSRKGDLESLSEQLHAYRTHMDEIPILRADLVALTEEEEQRLGALGETKWSAFVRGSLESERILALADRGSDHAARLREKEASKKAEQDALEAATTRLAESGSGLDESSLRDALDHARSRGDLDAALLAAERDTRLEEEALHLAMATLGLRTPTAAYLESLRPIPLERIEHFDRASQKATADARHAEALLTRVRAEYAATHDERIQLEAEGEIPSEEELRLVRAERDRTWIALRAHGVLAEGPASTFEHQIKESDTLSDRLRHEASRVSRRAHLAAKENSLAADVKAAELGVERVAATIYELENAWKEAWSESGIVPDPPGSMLSWTRRFHDAFARLERAKRAKEQEESLRAEQRTERTKVQRLLTLSEIPATFTEAKDRLQRAWESAAEHHQARRDLAQTVERTTRNLRALEREIQDLRMAEEEERKVWNEAASALHPRPLSKGDARTLLASCHELHDRRLAITKLRATLEKRERATEAFRERSAQLVRDLAPDLTDLPAEVAATKLLERFRTAERESNVRAHIEETIRAENARMDRLEHEYREQSLILEECLRRAQVTDLADLVAAEARSEELMSIRQKRAELEAVFADYANDIDAWEEELKGADRAALVRQQEELDYKRSELDDRIVSLNADIEGLQRGLDDTEHSAKAAQAAAIAEDKLTRLRAAVEEYAVTKLAIEVLRAEMDRYADEHQGPILQKTSAHFQRFTLGAYAGVRVLEDALICVRGDGSEVPIDKLSDGTRDQLYLALRLASFDRQKQSGALLPLVLDDILVHSDDDRARAILQSLAEVARSMQILFFTHHARIVELANESLNPALFRVHDLSPKNDLDPQKAQLLLS